MKIVLITQGISRLVNPLFGAEHQIVGVVESMPRNYIPGQKKNIFFELAKRIYSFLNKTPIILKKFCSSNNVPYNYICKGRDAEITDWVRDLKPDLIVVFSMSQLIKKDLINIPKYGAINMHPSFLPEYRGANPDFWQYYNMEMNPGVTIHYIDEGEDTGDIIYQERVHIPLGTKSPERLDKLITETGVPLMLKAIQAIKEGNAPRQPQTPLSPNDRARNLKPEEHAKIINWQEWPIERIWHILRGTELWLNAFEQPKGLYKGQRWLVGDFEKQINNHKAGSLVKYQGKYALAVPEGYIYLSKSFSVKKAILAMLKG